MNTPYENSTISGKQLWTGRILTGIAAAFFLFDAGMKLVKPVAVVKATVELGYPESTIVGIGVVLLLCTVLYLIPRTAVFGAVLLTGYLGGAVASNVRAGTPTFNIVFPVIFACILWGALYLRDRRVRSLLA
jgi:hypothetical protein